MAQNPAKATPMTLTCAHCGSPIHDGSSFCPQCGSSAASASETSPQHTLNSPPPLVPPQPALAGAPAATPFSNVLLDDVSHLQGIGGWLILVAIGLVLGPIVVFGQTLISLVPVLFAEQTQHFLETHPALHAIIIGEVVTNAIFVAILVWLNFLFFTKKRAFPSFMIFYLVFQVVITVADGYAAFRLMPSHAQVGMAAARAIIGACIWIPYLLVSRRVKLTFIN